MREIGQYILSVTAAAILAAVTRSLAGSDAMGAVIRLLGGIFVALTVLSPLVELEIPDLTRWMAAYSADGVQAAAAGADMAEQAQAAIIKEETRAYILDKAAQWNAEPEVSVTLDGNGCPVLVTITGNVSAEARRGMERMLEEDLGLGKEAQQWME